MHDNDFNSSPQCQQQRPIGDPLVDGVIAIAPGGDVNNATFREKVSASVELARELAAKGKGEEKTGFYDYEGTKGITPIILRRPCT